MKITAEIIKSLENLDEEQFNVTVHFIKGMEDGAFAPEFIAKSLDYIYRHYTDYLLRHDDGYCPDERDADRVSYLLLLKDLFTCSDLVW